MSDSYAAQFEQQPGEPARSWLTRLEGLRANELAQMSPGEERLLAVKVQEAQYAVEFRLPVPGEPKGPADSSSLSECKALAGNVNAKDKQAFVKWVRGGALDRS
jgi:hypothetical protein